MHNRFGPTNVHSQYQATDSQLECDLFSEFGPSHELLLKETDGRTSRDTIPRTMRWQERRLESARLHGKLYLPVQLQCALPLSELGVRTLRDTILRTTHW